MQTSLTGNNPFEGGKAEEEEEEEGFVDPELPYQVAEDGKGGDSFNMFPSRADEALKTRKHAERTTQNRVLHMRRISQLCTDVVEIVNPLPLTCPSVAALKQVLVTQLMSQEAAEQTKRSTGARLLRTTSLRTPVDSRARVMVHNGSEKNSSQTEDPTQDLGSGDTGFFDSPEDYGEPGQFEHLICHYTLLCRFK